MDRCAPIACGHPFERRVRVGRQLPERGPPQLGQQGPRDVGEGPRRRVDAAGQVGVPAAPAVAAVLMSRIIGYWLPVLPGWLAFNTATRNGTL